MGPIIPIFTARKFSEADVAALLPVVRRITTRAADEVDELQKRLEWVPRLEPLFERLNKQVESVIDNWAVKVIKLGCHPRGIWEVDFKADKGCYSWNYNENDTVCAFYNDEHSDLSPLFTKA